MPRCRAHRRRLSRAVLAVGMSLVAVVALACSSGSQPPGTPPRDLPAAPASPTHPNIVFLLTDDLSSDLLPYMPHVQELARQGMTFHNFIVDDSLCCPSRASILTGNYPHTTGIFMNHGSDGGFSEFNKRGEETDTFAIPMHDRGYRTAFMGKYLNEYHATYPAPEPLRNWTPPQATYVPPGWDEWDAVGNGYPQYHYLLNHNHQVRTYGGAPNAYLNTVLQNYGTHFIEQSAAKKAAFFLEIASFTPHTPDTPAPQDVGTYPGLTAPRDPSFGTLPENTPAWLDKRTPFSARQLKVIDTRFRMRVEAVQSVDRMVGALEAKLAATGQLQNTVFVFSSDNGYHDGQHDLMPGKMTAYDTDIRVPLIVTGPGIAPGSTNSDLVQNIDLAPTFEQLTGATPAPSVEGHSFVPLLHGAHPPWRSLALVEHQGPDLARNDPDGQNYAEGNPPTYQALRSSNFTYVRYVNGDHEYYDRTSDPYELDNLWDTLPPARVAQLNSWLDGLHTCQGGAQCWQAGRPTGY